MMKKRWMSILLTLCMLFTLLPMTALAAGTSETFADFALRMQSEYDVKVTCAADVTITHEQQGWIEQGLSLWGKDFMKVVSAGFGDDSYDQLQIRITNDGGSSGDFHASGMLMGNTIYLYPGWTYITVIHEIVHATNFSMEAKALDDIYKRDVDAEFTIKIAAVNEKFGSEPQGGKYGDAITTAYEDIAHILQNGYNSDWIAKIMSGSSPEIVAKIEVFRDFYVEYLTGGATPCLLVDSILGTNGVSISSQPAATTTVIEGNIEGSLSVDVTNSKGKKISYRWATSERNIFPPHGSLTQIKTASMEIPKSLKAGTYYYFCVIYVDGKEALNSNIARVIVKPKQTNSQTVTDVDSSTLNYGLNILSVPTKTVYAVGDGFDIAGARAVNKHRDGTIVEETENLKFFTSKTVELTQDRPFTTTGTKVVEIRHANSGVKWAEYTITVSEKGAASKHPFTDVKSGAYYEAPVIWALKNNVTAGTSGTTFSPNDTCTRGQVVTFLWRAKGQPEPTSTHNPFADVNSNDYYYKAVLWAVENGVTSGTSDTAFSPSDTCTSAQVVTFLWRSNNNPKTSGTSSLASQYSGQYYTDAVAWADATDLLSGTGTAFAPNNNSPRADIVTYLYRNAGSPNLE